MALTEDELLAMASRLVLWLPDWSPEDPSTAPDLPQYLAVWLVDLLRAPLRDPARPLLPPGTRIEQLLPGLAES